MLPRNVVSMLYTLFTTVVIVTVFFASKLGLTRQAWETDTTLFTTTIVAVAAVGFIAVTVALLRASDLIDRGTRVAPETLQAQIEPLEWIAYALNTLSFLAIVWGMIQGLSEVARSHLDDAQGAVLMAQVLVQHFNVALWPTATGIALYLVLQSYIVLLRYAHWRIGG